jgi:bifunctional DNA-binding transcriptional regulator/antitoxin component of YhaV-PrlF toxin-antitoxin module
MNIIGDHMKIDMDEVENIAETSLTIRGTRRRTTVPKVIVDKLKLNNGDKIRWILLKDHSILITKVK